MDYSEALLNYKNSKGTPYESIAWREFVDACAEVMEADKMLLRLMVERVGISMVLQHLSAITAP